jgi:hypothetical protein
MWELWYLHLSQETVVTLVKNRKWVNIRELPQENIQFTAQFR